MANLVGTSLGQYKITALLGEGGMADVYRARQESLKRDVAIKVMRLQLSLNPEFLKRFQREAQTIAALNHPHIIRIYDYGEQQDITYLVMDYLTGGSLDDLIKRERSLTPTDTSIILDQIASALDHAHRRGIIHRDLKPHNILFDESGSAILTDFGIAKLLDDTSIHTQTGVAIGTPAYMAPEQWQGIPIDARTDVYALGVIVYEMLTGHVPYTGTSPVTVMHRALSEPPRPLATYRSDLSEAVEAVITKALAKTQEARYQTAGELAAAFRLAISSLKAPSQRQDLSYEDERTMAVNRQTPPQQPPLLTPTPEHNPVVPPKTEREYTPPPSPPPRTQASTTRSRGLVTVVGALVALVLLGGAGLVLIPRLLPVAQSSTDTPTVTFTPNSSPTPADTATASHTPSATPTETTTLTATPSDTATPTVDPLTYTETARMQSVLQTIDAITFGTAQAATQAAEAANQTAAAIRATDEAIRNQAQIEATVTAALGQTGTAFMSTLSAVLTGTAAILAPTQTFEAGQTAQAIAAQATNGAQTAAAQATFSAQTAIAQATANAQAIATQSAASTQTAIAQATAATQTAVVVAEQETQTAVAAFSTQTAEAEKRNNGELIAGTRTAVAATSDAVRTQGAATLRAMMGGNETPVAAATLTEAEYTQYMVSLLDQGVLDSITGKRDFRFAGWESKATGTQTTHWDQWSTKSYTDYVMGVQFTWGTNVAKDACGIAARISDQSLYTFAVDHRGSLKWQTIISKNNVFTATNSKIVNTKAVNADENTMFLIVHGDTYQVVLNDQLVTTIRDSTIQQGNIGVLAYAGNDNATATCNYSNIWTWDLTATGTSFNNKSVSVKQTKSFVPGVLLNTSYTDFVIHAQITLTSDDQYDGCGFAFRQQGSTNNYYAMMYQQNQVVYFTKLVSNAWIKDYPSITTGQVRPNNGENDVVLVVQDGSFTAYFNGKRVLQYKDAGYKTGKLSLAGMHFDVGTGSTCQFKNGWVWSLDN